LWGEQAVRRWRGHGPAGRSRHAGRSAWWSGSDARHGCAAGNAWSCRPARPRGTARCCGGARWAWRHAGGGARVSRQSLDHHSAIAVDLWIFIRQSPDPSWSPVVRYISGRRGAAVPPGVVAQQHRFPPAVGARAAAPPVAGAAAVGERSRLRRSRKTRISLMKSWISIWAGECRLNRRAGDVHCVECVLLFRLAQCFCNTRMWLCQGP